MLHNLCGACLALNVCAAVLLTALVPRGGLPPRLHLAISAALLLLGDTRRLTRSHGCVLCTAALGFWAAAAVPGEADLAALSRGSAGMVVAWYGATWLSIPTVRFLLVHVVVVGAATAMALRPAAATTAAAWVMKSAVPPTPERVGWWGTG